MPETAAAEIETEQNEAATETMSTVTEAIESENQHHIEVEPLDRATTVAVTAVAAATVPLSLVRSLGSTRVRLWQTSSCSSSHEKAQIQIRLFHSSRPCSSSMAAPPHSHSPAQLRWTTSPAGSTRHSAAQRMRCLHLRSMFLRLSHLLQLGHGFRHHDRLLHLGRRCRQPMFELMPNCHVLFHYVSLLRHAVWFDLIHHVPRD